MQIILLKKIVEPTQERVQSLKKKLGCSADWSRSRFTMDKGLSDAVLEVFKKLYNKGYIYKGKRMINWCPCCNTSISDAEVVYEEEPTHLWHVKYKIVGEDRYLTIATTRPETMLGDTAVAVHPDDERYKNTYWEKLIEKCGYAYEKHSKSEQMWRYNINLNALS